MPGDDLVFLHSNRYPQCVARVDKHFVGYRSLQFSETGGVELWYGDEKFLLPEGAWFWPAHPGPRIRFHAAPGVAHWHHRYAAVQGSRVAQWHADGLWPEHPQRLSGGVEPFARRFDELLARIGDGARFSHLQAVNLLEGVLIDLAAARLEASARSSAPSAAWLHHVRQAILQAADDNLIPEYAEIARDNAMSLATLRRKFRATTGMPIHAYVVQRRIARARAMLGETDLPIKTIAELLGYNDVHFFSRQFRSSTGVAPHAYRRSRQA